MAGVEQLLPAATPARPISTFSRGHSHVSWLLDSGLVGWSAGWRWASVIRWWSMGWSSTVGSGSTVRRYPAVGLPGVQRPRWVAGCWLCRWYLSGRDAEGASRVHDASTDAVSAGLALLGHLAAGVSPAVRPAVAHGDVYLPNMLLDEAGRFQVSLDLEHVR